MKLKTYIALFYIVWLSLGTIVSLTAPKTAASSSEVQVIPAKAIRLRILANSNKEQDQAVKRSIRDEVNLEISEWVKDLTSIEEARKVISSHLPELESIATKELEKDDIDQPVKVEFGKTLFPTKLYGQFLYPAGEYEAIKITIGEGEGDNWWCVLFPPLCFLDFASGTAVEKQDAKAKTAPVYETNDEEPIRAKFFLVEWFNKIF